MSKARKKRRKSRGAAKTVTVQQIIMRCVVTAFVAFLIFLLCTALLAKMYLQQDGNRVVFQIFMPVICAVSFFLCGFLTTFRNKAFGTKEAFLAGFLCLLLLLITLLTASKCTISLFILLPVALGLVLPPIGGYIGNRV